MCAGFPDVKTVALAVANEKQQSELQLLMLQQQMPEIQLLEKREGLKDSLSFIGKP